MACHPSDVPLSLARHSRQMDGGELCGQFLDASGLVPQKGFPSARYSAGSRAGCEPGVAHWTAANDRPQERNSKGMFSSGDGDALNPLGFVPHLPHQQQVGALNCYLI